MNLQRLLQFAAWPTAIGIIIALLAMLLFPQLRGQNAAPLLATKLEASPASYADAVSRAAPAVVNIYTQKKVLERDPRYATNPYYRHLYDSSDIPLRERMQNTLGSGVIVDTQGFILTNNHVINGADTIMVLLNDGRNSSAEVVGIDTENDLAVLKIGLDKLTTINTKLSHNIRVGDVVLAIGNPYGVGQSVSQGIVSATGRWNLGISSNENFIQTDAAISPGNSGGALIDATGNLIGINTAQLDNTGATSGISFAVPADIAMDSLKQIIQYGEIRHGWLGLTANVLDEKRTKIYGSPGWMVSEVDENGPSEKAGILAEDIIIQINDIDFRQDASLAGSYHSAYTLLKNLRPNATVKLKLLRAGKTIDVIVTAESKPSLETKT